MSILIKGMDMPTRCCDCPVCGHDYQFCRTGNVVSFGEDGSVYPGRGWWVMDKCSGCKHFDYDEIWDGEEEIEIFCCGKGHYEHIGWNTEPCEDYEEGE